MTQQFVGFGTAENFIKAVDKNKPLNAESILDPGKFGKFGICLVSEVIVLSQVQGNEVMYCRMTVGRFQSMDGHSEIGGERNYRRPQSAWELTQEWLKENGVTFREALIAMPKTLKFLDASWDFMRWDKEAKEYKKDE